eukprot:gene17800-24206_t
MRQSRFCVHVGVWLAADGGGVLHCVQDSGVVFQSNMNTSNVIWLRNPFQIDSREVYPVKPGSTVRDWLDSQGVVEFELPTVCILNGTPLLRADWPAHGFAQSDVAVFIALPLGGGGGGKNPLRTVLMIAVMVVANVYGGPLAGAMGFSGTFATAA